VLPKSGKPMSIHRRLRRVAAVTADDTKVRCLCRFLRVEIQRLLPLLHLDEIRWPADRHPSTETALCLLLCRRAHPGWHSLRKPSLTLQSQETAVSYQDLWLEKVTLCSGALLMESFEVSVIQCAMKSGVLPHPATKRIMARNGRPLLLQIALLHR
jgi:hypothetical protein